MTLDRWFRLSNYVTLGLSCAALVFAEAAYLPDLSVCLAPVLVLLVLAWWVEGRWVLPAWGANVLGILIAAGGAAWLTTHLSDRESWQSKVPLYLALVPYTGPLLMAALLVKLFRPRRRGEFWLLQGLGLMQVSLGCVLAGGPEFGALLAGYLASALACLALHYRLSAQAEGGARMTDDGWRAAARWLLPFTFRWTLGVGGLALLLSLLTPRSPDAGWDPQSNFIAGKRPARISAGVSEEINLNRIGTVELDDEVALRVTAIDGVGQPKRDLSGDQRWRGAVLDWYDGGKWMTVHQMPRVDLRRAGQQELPDLGAGQYFLTFTIRPRLAGGLVLAEPIHLGTSPARLPVLSVPAPGRRPAYFVEMSGTVLPVMFSPRLEYQYRQVLPARADPARMPAEPLEDMYFDRLRRQSVPGLRDWTLDLLRRLSAQPRSPLPDAIRAPLARPEGAFTVDPEHWEVVARALTHYLADSGDYTYTLVITRQDLTIDPVMDFLVNLKQGHCERYATALALMLRSVGIPARVVKGFRGTEHEGDGAYVVRHSHAHAWVEMLVPRRDPPGKGYDWLTLDPTPSDSASDADALSLAHWWQEGQRSMLQLWHTLIVDYNADEQADLWDNLKSGRRLPTLLKLGLLLLAVPAALLAFVLVRRQICRRRANGSRPAEVVAFYARLVALLTRHLSLRPQSGQTPREYSEVARRFLRALPGSAALADLPGRVSELFYRVRFGDRPLSEPESQALNAELDRLAAALRQAGRH
jgi:transglutaminase-like putative cysteine protease